MCPGMAAAALSPSEDAGHGADSGSEHSQAGWREVEFSDSVGPRFILGN